MKKERKKEKSTINKIEKETHKSTEKVILMEYFSPNNNWKLLQSQYCRNDGEFINPWNLLNSAIVLSLSKNYAKANNFFVPFLLLNVINLKFN